MGKSTLAKLVLEKEKISWMPLDIIRGALSSMSPELGIQEGKNWWIGHHEKFFPFLQKLIHRIVESDLSYVLEGDSFLPKHVERLKEKFPIRACFLGASRLDIDVLTKHKGVNDYWLGELSEEDLKELPDWIVKKSSEYEISCKELGIKYFDVSLDHKQAIDDAFQYLMQGKIASM